MTSRKKQFIAGAVCPTCSDMDSLVLFTDDQSVECVSCSYTQTSAQRDQAQQKKQQASKNEGLTDVKTRAATKITKNVKFKDASLIDVTQIKE